MFETTHIDTFIACVYFLRWLKSRYGNCKLTPWWELIAFYALQKFHRKTQCRFHQKVFRKKDWFVVDNVHFQFLSFFKHVIWWKWNSLHISMTMLVLAAVTHPWRFSRTRSWSLSDKNGISQQVTNKQSYEYISILYFF